MAPGILINIDVDDLPRAVAFYCALLDLKVGRRFGDGGVQLIGAAVPLFLLVKKAGTVASATTGEQRRYTRALAAGATIDDPAVSYRWGRIAHLADPFGHGFCLVQFLGRGYDEVATT
jgi:predicted enzyme related to lactoylglutathione lyase